MFDICCSRKNFKAISSGLQKFFEGLNLSAVNAFGRFEFKVSGQRLLISERLGEITLTNM